MAQLVRDGHDIHKIHVRTAEVLRQIKALPNADGDITSSSIRDLNDHIRRLNAFFEQRYVTTPDDQYSPPSISIVGDRVLDSWAYKSNDTKRYFDDVIRKIHDVIQNLPFVHVVAGQKELKQPMGFGR